MLFLSISAGKVLLYDMGKDEFPEGIGEIALET